MRPSERPEVRRRGQHGGDAQEPTRGESLLKKHRDGLPVASVAPQMGHSSAFLLFSLVPDLVGSRGFKSGESRSDGFGFVLMCSWRACRRWSRRCSRTTAPCSWRPSISIKVLFLIWTGQEDFL